MYFSLLNREWHEVPRCGVLRSTAVKPWYAVLKLVKNRGSGSGICGTQRYPRDTAVLCGTNGMGRCAVWLLLFSAARIHNFPSRVMLFNDSWILEDFPADWLSVIDACVIRQIGAIHVPVVCLCLLFRKKAYFCFCILCSSIFDIFDRLYSMQVTQEHYTCLQIQEIILK